MNEDFEAKLQSLRPCALPDVWRAEILGKAAAAVRRSALPPRSLVVGWSVAWAAVIMLYLTTPVKPTGGLTATAPCLHPRLQERAQALNALLALNADSPALNP